MSRQSKPNDFCKPNKCLYDFSYMYFRFFNLIFFDNDRLLDYKSKLYFVYISNNYLIDLSP